MDVPEIGISNNHVVAILGGPSPDQLHFPTAPVVEFTPPESSTCDITFAPNNGLKDQKLDKRGLSPVSCKGGM